MFTPSDSQLKSMNKLIKKFIDDYDGNEIFSSKISVVSLREDVVNNLPDNLQSKEYRKVLLTTYPNTIQGAKKVLSIFKKKFKVAHYRTYNSLRPFSEYQDNLVLYILPK